MGVGIGKAVALGWWRGLTWDRRSDQVRINGARAELAVTGRRIVGWSCDTRNDESVQSMVEGLAGAAQGVDILVNAAAMPGGVVRPPRLGEITTEALWRRSTPRSWAIYAAPARLRRAGQPRTGEVSSS